MPHFLRFLYSIQNNISILILHFFFLFITIIITLLFLLYKEIFHNIKYNSKFYYYIMCHVQFSLVGITVYIIQGVTYIFLGQYFLKNN